MKNQIKTSEDFHRQKHTHSQTLRRDSVKTPELVENKFKDKKIKKTGHIIKVDDARLKRAINTPKSTGVNKFNFSKIIPTNQPRLSKKGYLAKTLVNYEDYFNAEDDELFKKALRRAQFYQNNDNTIESEQKSRSSRPKHLATAMIVTLLVLGMGFLTYKNLPNTRSVILSRDTGFLAQTPTFSLAGFYQQNQTAKFGYFSSTYISNTDSRQYTISETPKNMTNQMLMNTYVATNYKNYLDLKFSNLELYVSSDLSKATWIKNNIWFKLTNKSALSLNQIIKLAQSS